MIVGFSGFRGSGKDTVAAYLVKEHGFERKCVCRSLKRSIAAHVQHSFQQISTSSRTTRKWYRSKVPMMVNLVKQP